MLSCFGCYCQSQTLKREANKDSPTPVSWPIDDSLRLSASAVISTPNVVEDLTAETQRAGGIHLYFFTLSTMLTVDAAPPMLT
jgi:hypothetical protein